MKEVPSEIFERKFEEHFKCSNSPSSRRHVKEDFEAGWDARSESFESSKAPDISEKLEYTSGLITMMKNVFMDALKNKGNKDDMIFKAGELYSGILTSMSDIKGILNAKSGE